MSTKVYQVLLSSSILQRWPGLKCLPKCTKCCCHLQFYSGDQDWNVYQSVPSVVIISNSTAVTRIEMSTKVYQVLLSSPILQRWPGLKCLPKCTKCCYHLQFYSGDQDWNVYQSVPSVVIIFNSTAVTRIEMSTKVYQVLLSSPILQRWPGLKCLPKCTKCCYHLQFYSGDQDWNVYQSVPSVVIISNSTAVTRIEMSTKVYQVLLSSSILQRWPGLKCLPKCTKCCYHLQFYSGDQDWNVYQSVPSVVIISNSTAVTRIEMSTKVYQVLLSSPILQRWPGLKCLPKCTKCCYHLQFYSGDQDWNVYQSVPSVVIISNSTAVTRIEMSTKVYQVLLSSPILQRWPGLKCLPKCTKCCYHLQFYSGDQDWNVYQSVPSVVIISNSTAVTRIEMSTKVYQVLLSSPILQRWPGLKCLPKCTKCCYHNSSALAVCDMTKVGWRKHLVSIILLDDIDECLSTGTSN